MVYRFRVTYEDHEDVYRDIEIKSSQNFQDFHSIIQQSIAFDNSKSATFFTSDDHWRKEEEILLEPKKDDKKSKRHEEPVKRKAIADYVNDPHQKFIYVFDPDVEWTFQIELLKIIPDEKKDYPICVKSNGTAPKQYKETNLPPPPPEDEDEEPKKIKDEKEKLMESAAEKAVVAEDEEDLIPLALGDDNVKTGEEEEEEKPADEDEEGESSEGFEFEDED